MYKNKQASGNDFSHGCQSLSPGYGYEVMMKLVYVFNISTVVQRVHESPITILLNNNTADTERY